MVMPFSSTVPLSTLTPEYVKTHYLTGLTLCGADGEELPDEWFTEKIAIAISNLEDISNVDILQRVNRSEHHDYVVQDYMRYAFLQLFRLPALSVQEVRARYPTGQLVQVFPSAWAKLETVHSQIHLVPTAGTLSQVVVGQGGEFLPLIYGGVGYLPHLWEVDYTSGFSVDAVPRMVMDAICKMAVVDMLTVMADLVTPIGQTSTSLSIDGLSQSKSYNLPAFKARIDKYSADLGLPASPGQPAGESGLIAQMRNTYLGINLASV